MVKTIKKTVEKKEEIPVMLNPQITSTFSDGVRFFMNEKMCTMVFHHKVGGKTVLEQGRFVITEDLTKKCIDAMCQLTKYYPKKPKPPAINKN